MPYGDDYYFSARHLIEYQVRKWSDQISPETIHVGSLARKWLINQKIEARFDSKLNVFCP